MGNMQTTDQWGSLLPKGLGTDQDATQATAAMRQSPWYQDWAKKNNLQFQGDQYGNARLNDDQQQQLYDLALKNGIGLNDKYDQIDENGQISEAHHKLRNTLIGLAIGGAAATGLGAAGIGPLSGIFGGASGLSGAGGLSAGMSAGTSGAGAAATAAGAGSTMAGLLPGSQAAMDATTAAMAGSGAGSLAAPESISGLLAANSPQMIPNALSTTMGGSQIANTLGSGGSKAKSFLDLITGADNNPFANLSSGLGSLEQGLANRRVQGGNFAQAYDRNMIAAQQDADRSRADALKNLQRTSYITGQQSGYTPANISLASGKHVQLPDFGYGYKAPTADEKQGAELLKAQALKTLGPGGTYTPVPLETYRDAGLGENLATAGSTITGLMPSVGSFLKLFGK